MKRLRAALALTLLVSAIGIGAPKAQAQSGTVDVGVNVNFAHALDIRAIRHVEFGTMTISPIPGSVVLDETTGTIAVGGGVLAPPEQGTFHRGEIQFTAPDNGLVSIFPTNPNVLLTGNNTALALYGLLRPYRYPARTSRRANRYRFSLEGPSTSAAILRPIAISARSRSPSLTSDPRRRGFASCRERSRQAFLPIKFLPAKELSCNEAS